MLDTRSETCSYKADTRRLRTKIKPKKGTRTKEKSNSRKLKAVPRLIALMGLQPPGQVVEAAKLLEQQAQQVEQAWLNPRAK